MIVAIYARKSIPAFWGRRGGQEMAADQLYPRSPRRGRRGGGRSSGAEGGIRPDAREGAPYRAADDTTPAAAAHIVVAFADGLRDLGHSVAAACGWGRRS
jgi:hypothetical protein